MMKKLNINIGENEWKTLDQQNTEANVAQKFNNKLVNNEKAHCNTLKVSHSHI
jgi:hypothetical protein